MAASSGGEKGADAAGGAGQVLGAHLSPHVVRKWKSLVRTQKAVFN